jgi:hypothetical protein
MLKQDMLATIVRKDNPWLSKNAKRLAKDIGSLERSLVLSR